MTAKQLGEVVQRERKRQNMTQPDLAFACGTGVRFIVDLEKGKETCQIGKALYVMQMLGINILLSRVGNEQILVPVET